MQDAELAFADLAVTEEDAKVLIQKARSYAASVEGTDLKFVPAAHSWLRAGRYDDPDLFTSNTEQEREWFRQCWRDVNTKAVENRYHVRFDKQYPPDDVTTADAISTWYRETARAWISQIAQEKLSGA